MATSKNYNYGKKKGSDHFRNILNPYGEKPNYGKIGRRRRLSKLNVFFSIILSVTIYIIWDIIWICGYIMDSKWRNHLSYGIARKLRIQGGASSKIADFMGFIVDL